MKILLDGRLISNNPTGISRYSYEIIQMYQNKYGYENVEVILNDANKLLKKDFKYIETKYKPFNIKDFLFFHKFLKKVSFDVYHSLYYSNSFFKKKGVKYITTVHDLLYKVVPGFFGKNKFKNIIGIIYFDFIVKKSIKNSDNLISVSKTTEEDLKKIFGYESVYIPEGINEISLNEKKIEKISPHNYFLYVGNSRPHKNLDFLINSFMKSKTKYELIICGNNNYIKNKDVRIKTLGYVSEEQLNWLYQNSKAFIFPSLYEGFGLPILEALQKGAKVISSNGGSLKEFSDKLVYYFNPKKEEELIQLIENVDNLNKNEKMLKEELSKYSWDKVENQMNIYWESIGI